MDEQVRQIQAAMIDPGRNHRTVFDQDKLAELAESIARNGLAQPVTVRPKPDGRYEIVAGERRFRACSQVLGWEFVPAIVRELDDRQANAIMLAENTGREDLNPIDEANAYERTVQEFGYSVAEVSQAAGVSQARVRSMRKLLLLIPEVQRLIMQGALPVGLGQEMSVLDEARQRLALQWLNDQPMLPSRKMFARVVGELYEAQQQGSLFDLSQFTLRMDVAKALQQQDGHLRTILPKRGDLPALPNRMGSMGEVIDQYAAALLEAGHTNAATVIIDFWAKLMESNYAVIPATDSQVVLKYSEVLM